MSRKRGNQWLASAGWVKDTDEKSKVESGENCNQGCRGGEVPVEDRTFGATRDEGRVHGVLFWDCLWVTISGLGKLWRSTEAREGCGEEAARESGELLPSHASRLAHYARTHAHTETMRA